jgi:hypothetical protein
MNQSTTGCLLKVYEQVWGNSNFDIVSELLVVLIIFGKTYSISNFDIVSKLLIVSIIFGRQLMNYCSAN